MELLSQQEQESLEHFQSSKSGFFWFSLFFSQSRLAAAPPGGPGSNYANGKRSLESPRSCYRGFWDHDPPLGHLHSSKQLQDVSKPFPRRAGSSPGFQRDIRGAGSHLWKALPVSLQPFHTPGIQSRTSPALRAFPSPIPCDLLGSMECFGSNAHSVQENLGMCLDDWGGAGWINLWIRTEGDCSWSPDPTTNPQGWTW